MLQKVAGEDIGLTSEEIELLEVRQHAVHSMIDFDTDHVECLICKEEFRDKDRYYQLDCNHKFHLNCLKEWIAKTSKCPLCRTPVLSVANVRIEPELSKYIVLPEVSHLPVSYTHLTLPTIYSV
eukprot:TRINITY_DN14226_c0_g2_i1.p1 TRINITY_DN14226_c0_g2~~TRINITY_DN14226_c0_g2_i1.p1  ORF type:complete len:124 (-),score=12.29 TRINITY_DN14226_c0_g2_i1:33-404(-)